MDYGVKMKRKENPREKSNILETLLFIFAFDTIGKGVRSDLKEKDIYATMKKYKSDSLGNRLEILWKEEVKKPKPKLILCIFKMFGLEYVILGIVLFIYDTAILILRPTFAGKLVSYFEPHPTVTRNEAILYGVGLLLCSFTYSLLNPTCYLILQEICLRIRIAICSLLYRKCLKLNLANSSEFASGTAVILMTKDIARFESALDYIHIISAGIFQLIILTCLMYQEIGVAALIGTSLLFFMLPIIVCLGRRVESYRIKTSENTDERIKVTQEILTAIRIIKMYTWEFFFSNSIKKLRKKEIKNLRVVFYLKAIITCIGQLSSRIALFICIMTYILLGNHITAEKAFIVLGYFTGLSTALNGYLPTGIPYLAELYASLTRLRDFLLLDEVTPDHGFIKMYNKTPQVTIENVTVKVHKTVILSNINVEIHKGLSILTGNVGSGKSTFLKIILGDVKKETGTVAISGEVSYASQDPWLFPSTVRQNIIFGEEFDQNRYEEIVEVCALKRDFTALEDGDQTLVSDKGLNLSRGQKTRINLARAIYKKADIYLLDDCLSAVDAHVSKQIFYECIKGFLVDKVCVLVTHQKDLLEEADNIILLGEGSIKFKGSYLNLQNCDNTFKLLPSNKNVNQRHQYLREDSQLENICNATDRKDSLIETGYNLNNNVYSETKEEGGVKLEVYRKYFTYGGGLLMILFVVFISIITQIASSWSDYFVSDWVDMEQEMSGFKYNHTTDSLQYKKLTESYSTFLLQYSLVILAATFCTVLRSLATYIFASMASVNIHKSIFARILNAGIIFFDTNLSGNMLNRLSRDLGIIDEQLPFTAFDVLQVTLSLAGILFVVSSVNLYFIIPSIILSAILVIARYLYMPTGRSIRRLEGATRSPMIGHLNATLEGLTTIRASKTQELLRKEFDEHQDIYNSVSYMQLATTRAFGFYVDVLCAVYITIITFSFILVKTDALAGEVGLAITQSFALTGILLWGVRGWAELENQMTSAERVLEYSKIESENKSGDKLEDWPKTGEIEYNKVSLRYSPTGGRVLKNVSFSIKPNTKIGIVGRTGAGKSSILSVLFRLYDFEGSITIDNANITGVEVNLLRSKISIIPQDPVLFSGTVRNNLDPDMKYDDKELWDALEEVEIKPLVDSLNMNITDSGSNFSIGQRQLFCLARAVVNKNNILVLDEATANVDPYTDDLIQRTIQKKFINTTVITVAHRLPNVMDSDKILVMDSGEVIEYDQPNVLLNNKNGMFYKMVRKAGLLQHLD